MYITISETVYLLFVQVRNLTHRTDGTVIELVWPGTKQIVNLYHVDALEMARVLPKQRYRKCFEIC